MKTKPLKVRWTSKADGLVRVSKVRDVQGETVWVLKETNRLLVPLVAGEYEVVE